MLAPEIARSCFERDGWKCRQCLSTSGLHPHHLVYKSHGGPDTLANLLTLDWRCHRMHHDGFLDIEWGELGGNGPVTFTRKKGYRIL